MLIILIIEHNVSYEAYKVSLVWWRQTTALLFSTAVGGQLSSFEFTDQQLRISLCGNYIHKYIISLDHHPINQTLFYWQLAPWDPFHFYLHCRPPEMIWTVLFNWTSFDYTILSLSNGYLVIFFSISTLELLSILILRWNSVTCELFNKWCLYRHPGNGRVWYVPRRLETSFCTRLINHW